MKFCALLFITTVSLVSGAKILALFHMPSRSHHILGDALLKGLAKKGHEVTMLSPFPSKSNIPNYIDIELEGLMQFKKEKMDPLTYGNMSFIKMFLNSPSIMKNMSELVLSNPPLRKILDANKSYDIFITELFANEAFLGIGQKLKAHNVIFNPVGSTTMTDKIAGNPSPLSYIPHFFLPFSNEMSFLQRVANTLISVLFDVIIGMTSHEQELLSKYFPDAPPLEDLKNNVSLILVNSHYSTEFPRPHVPNVVPIGGFHLQEPKELKGKLKTFLDEAKGGVIFMSFGSNVKISNLPKEKLDHFINTFNKINMTVLWKSETEIEDISNNVMLEKWLPQNDVLAHQNVKLFISHGGFGSTTEAIYHGVPMIGIPFFGDQSRNVADCVRKGFAVQIELSEVTEEKLQNAIDEILNNPKYRNNIKRVSSLLRDQPIKPIDNAVFWIEHIIRHNGGAHLKNSGVKLAWYQYFLLDVIAFIIAMCILIMFLVYVGCRSCFRCTKSRIESKFKKD